MIPVSVIIPVFNVEQYLPICIESILRQTFSNIEIILVDDGSTDRSGDICEEYRKSDTRIKVIHKSNGGLVSARKAGFSQSTGEYILHVDSDDWVEIFHVEKLYEAAVAHNADIVGCNYFTDNDSGQSVCQDNKPSSFDVKSYIEMCLKGEIHSGVVFRMFSRRLYLHNDVQFPVCDFNEDLHHTISLAIHASKIIHCDMFSYHYRLNSSSLTQRQSVSDRIRKFKEYARNMADLYYRLNICETFSCEDIFMKTINERKRTMIVNNISQPDDVKSALAYFKNSFSFKEIRNAGDFIYYFASRWGYILPYIIRYNIKKLMSR